MYWGLSFNDIAVCWVILIAFAYTTFLLSMWQMRQERASFKKIKKTRKIPLKEIEKLFTVTRKEKKDIESVVWGWVNIFNPTQKELEKIINFLNIRIYDNYIKATEADQLVDDQLKKAATVFKERLDIAEEKKKDALEKIKADYEAAIKKAGADRALATKRTFRNRDLRIDRANEFITRTKKEVRNLQKNTRAHTKSKIILKKAKQIILTETS